MRRLPHGDKSSNEPRSLLPLRAQLQSHRSRHSGAEFELSRRGQVRRNLRSFTWRSRNFSVVLFRRSARRLAPSSRHGGSKACPKDALTPRRSGRALPWLRPKDALTYPGRRRGHNCPDRTGPKTPSRAVARGGVTTAPGRQKGGLTPTQTPIGRPRVGDAGFTPCNGTGPKMRSRAPGRSGVTTAPVAAAPRRAHAPREGAGSQLPRGYSRGDRKEVQDPHNDRLAAPASGTDGFTPDGEV